jgi:hypothetical protein
LTPHQTKVSCGFFNFCKMFEARILQQAGVTFDAQAEPGKLRVVA